MLPNLVFVGCVAAVVFVWVWLCRCTFCIYVFNALFCFGSWVFACGLAYGGVFGVCWEVYNLNWRYLPKTVLICLGCLSEPAVIVFILGFRGL